MPLYNDMLQEWLKYVAVWAVIYLFLPFNRKIEGTEVIYNYSYNSITNPPPVNCEWVDDDNDDGDWLMKKRI